MIMGRFVLRTDFGILLENEHQGSEYLMLSVWCVCLTVIFTDAAYKQNMHMSQP